MAFGVNTDALAQQMIGGASNILQGENPAYTKETFLAVYPQFSTNCILTALLNAGGSGYSVDDVLTIVQTDADGGTVQVTSVGTTGVSPNVVTGVVTGIALRAKGSGYSTYNGLATTAVPAGGTGCKVNITASSTLIPNDMLDLFIAMATASIQKVRWCSKWDYAISLYIAHFCTLYLQSLAPAGSSAAQVVASAQAQYPRASKSVGDVSVSYDTSSINGDLPGWAAWKSTTYGLQLATLARIVGQGGMYVW